MGDQDKGGGSVSLTAPVEDVMKRICSNSKVSKYCTINCTTSQYNTSSHTAAQVDGVVVVNNEGIPIKSTLDSTSTVQVRSIASIRAVKSSGVLSLELETNIHKV